MIFASKLSRNPYLDFQQFSHCTTYSRNSKIKDSRIFINQRIFISYNYQITHIITEESLFQLPMIFQVYHILYNHSST